MVASSRAVDAGHDNAVTGVEGGPSSRTSFTAPVALPSWTPKNVPGANSADPFVGLTSAGAGPQAGCSGAVAHRTHLTARRYPASPSAESSGSSCTALASGRRVCPPAAWLALVPVRGVSVWLGLGTVGCIGYTG